MLLVTGCSTKFDKDNICSIYDANPGWEDTMGLVEEKWGVSAELLMAVARYESSFEAEARSPRRRYFGFIPGKRISTAYGYSQALDSTWQEYIERTNSDGADRNSFEDALNFIGWYMRRANRSLNIPLSDGYKLYLVYHEGHRGFLSGRYKSSPKLMLVAHKVESMRRIYRKQLNRCRPN